MTENFPNLQKEADIQVQKAQRVPNRINPHRATPRRCCCLVAESCPLFHNPRDCSPPGSSVQGISQARRLERVAIFSSRGSLHPGIDPKFPALQADSLLISHQGSPKTYYDFKKRQKLKRNSKGSKRKTGGSVIKNLPANVRDVSLIPGSGRSPGEGNGNPLQCSCLENPMDRGAWRDAVHGVAETMTRLSN